MTTPQHAIDAAKEINAALSRTHYVNIAAIIARHPDPELARLREENERLKAKINHFTDEHTKPHSLDDATMREWDLANKVAQLRARVAELEASDEKRCEVMTRYGAELADLRRDREDLDWLEKHFHEVRRQDPGPTMDCEPVSFSVWTPEHGRTNRFTDLRSAVRAARAKDAKTEGQPYYAKAHNSLQP